MISLPYNGNLDYVDIGISTAVRKESCTKMENKTYGYEDKNGNIPEIV